MMCEDLERGWRAPPRLPGSVPHTDDLLSPCPLLPRTPAMIGCSFIVDREYFGDIGLLDPGMEVYGGENIELGMRVSVAQPLGPLHGDGVPRRPVESCAWLVCELLVTGQEEVKAPKLRSI